MYYFLEILVIKIVRTAKYLQHQNVVLKFTFKYDYENTSDF